MRAAIIALLVAACSSGSGESEKAPQDKPRVAELADEACACPDLGCVDRVQQTFARIVERQHGSAEATRATEAARERIEVCTARLADDVIDKIADLADELCACQDRACYDALRPKVNQVFSRSNAAGLPPATVARIQAEADRFNRCDERFTAPPQ